MVRRLVVAALLVASCVAVAEKRKVILDQDAFGTGGPNMQPLLMALQAPDVEVLGITVESGDGWQDENVAHTLRMLELVHRTDVPVYRGATYPLINSEKRTEAWESMHGALGYKGAFEKVWPESAVHRSRYHEADVVPPLPEGMPTTKAAEGTAAEFLVRMVRKYPGQVSIVSMGPVTNIALAAKLDDSFGANVKELVQMGGSFHPVTQTPDEFSDQMRHTPVSDFNFRWDPEAAHIMLQSGIRKIVIVPADATMDTKFTRPLLEKLERSKSLAAKYVVKYPGVDFPLWDETALAVWLDPSVILVSKTLALDVDTNPTSAAYGTTLSWPEGKGPHLGEPAVQVVFRVKVPELDEIFVKTLSGK